MKPSASKLQAPKGPKAKRPAKAPTEETKPGGNGVSLPLVRIPKAAEIVAGHIRKMILRRELKEGDYLAPENQLLRNFGISRPTLREALRILETEQFISVSRGSRTGAVVHLPKADTAARYAGFTLQSQGTTLADVYSARMAIMPYAARLLAQVGDPKTVKRLKEEMQSLYALGGSPKVVQFQIAVARMHRLMVQLTGNRTLTLLLDLIEEVLERHQSRFTGDHLGMTEAERAKFLHRGLRSFDKLIELIEAKEPARAEAHWRAHIENANAHWLAGLDRTTVLDLLD
ncbi:MAG: FadR family transcriptional regulator [Alphaproteobacteria bacterium]|nr:FadR family transcriptional regulator [Alphaproteobacteria bacterium]